MESLSFLETFQDNEKQADVQNHSIATDQVDAGIVPDANASYKFYDYWESNFPVSYEKMLSNLRYSVVKYCPSELFLRVFSNTPFIFVDLCDNVQVSND